MTKQELLGAIKKTPNVYVRCSFYRLLGSRHMLHRYIRVSKRSIIDHLSTLSDIYVFSAGVSANGDLYIGPIEHRD
jgi:hypothetical protein